jgi:hypothetical protein
MARSAVVKLLGNPDYSNADTLAEKMVYADNHVFEEDTRFVVVIKDGHVVKTGMVRESGAEIDVNITKDKVDLDE